MAISFINNSCVDTVTLDDLCDVITKGTTPTTLGKKFMADGINFIKAESVLNNHIIDKNKLSFIDDDTHNLLKRSQIEENDVVLSIAGTIGRFAFVPNDYVPANTNQAVCIIRPKNINNLLLIYSYFCTGKQNIFFEEHTVQGVQANISLSTVGKTPIPNIKNDIFYKKTLTIFERIKNVIKENEKLNELKQMYLKKFFD